MLLKKVDQKAGEDVGIWKKTCSILGPPKIFLAFPVRKHASKDFPLFSLTLLTFQETQKK